MKQNCEKDSCTMISRSWCASRFIAGLAVEGLSSLTYSILKTALEYARPDITSQQNQYLVSTASSRRNPFHCEK